MKVDFDPAKNARTLAKRGFSLRLGQVVLTNRVADTLDLRNYGEIRRVAFGLVDGRLFVCVYTMRGDTHWIISVRKANKREQRRWLSR